MAYDLHAFPKVLVGTQLTADNANVNLVDGFVVTAGLGTQVLNETSATVNNNYGVGTYGMFDSKTYLSVTAASLAGSCCPLILASASVYSRDSIGPFIGGMQETNKTKIINPRYVTEFYRTDPCTASQHIIHIGTTNYTSTTSPVNPACNFEFLCGETYSLRLDIKGSPVLRFLTRQNYLRIPAYTGCCSDIPSCPGGAPCAVDSTLVMILWAQGIIDSPLVSPFVSPIVYDETGTAWYAPGTNGGVSEWDNYVSTGHIDGATAGIRLIGAYVGTSFKDCTFQTTDFFEREPVILTAGMVDLSGDPCTFEGICVVTECLPVQGMGFGEQVVRDFILSERYRQFNFNTDLRMRETQLSDEILDVISRTAQYTRYTIIHSVPRPINPSGIYDADKYRVELISSGTNAAFETFMATWLDGCNGCAGLTVYDCTPCVPVAI